VALKGGEGENDDVKGFIGADDERGRASSFLRGHGEAGDGVGRTRKRPGGHRRQAAAWRPTLNGFLK
jgi:hypothetical protein